MQFVSKKIILGGAFSVVIFFVMSCKHKPTFGSFPVVYYSSDIAPIISGNCTFSGCHGSIDSKKFKLSTYDDLMKYCDVEAYSPWSSKLYSIIKSQNEDDIMPRKPYSQLTEKQMQLIYVWIGQGTKNN